MPHRMHGTVEIFFACVVSSRLAFARIHVFKRKKVQSRASCQHYPNWHFVKKSWYDGDWYFDLLYCDEHNFDNESCNAKI